MRVYILPGGVFPDHEDTDPYYNRVIPHTLVLKPGLVAHGMCNGSWHWGGAGAGPKPSAARVIADMA